MIGLEQLIETVEEQLGLPGRMISSSKGQYLFDNPDHLVVFNSNLLIRDDSNDTYIKVWHGDIDLTTQEQQLRSLFSKINKPMYVLYESDARFENEKAPKVERFVYFIDGNTTKHPREYMRDSFGHLILKPIIQELPTDEELKKDRLKLASQYKQSEFKKLLDPEQDYEGEHNDHSFPVESLWEDISRDISPMHKFQDLARDIYGVSNEEVLSIYVTESVYEELERLTLLWTQAVAGHLTKYQLQKEVSFAMFNYAPMRFQADPEWAEDGCIYIRLKDKSHAE